MKRYIPSSRGITKNKQEEFLDSLNSEAQKLLTQLTQQFVRDLQSQASQLLRSGSGESDGRSTASSGLPSVGGLFGTAARMIISRPDKTSETTRQSDRSQAVEAEFRLSRAQMAAEAGQTLQKGDKNT